MSSKIYNLKKKIPGGYLSIKFGPKIVLAISYLLGSILTVLLPVFARSSYIALIACRFCIGLLHVCIYQYRLQIHG